MMYKYLALVFVTVVQTNKWPDPKNDPLIFIANPVEANMPGHWVPGSIVKAILQKSTPFDNVKRTTTSKRTTTTSTLWATYTVKDKLKQSKPTTVKNDESGTSEEVKETSEEVESTEESTPESTEESTPESTEESTPESAEEPTEESTPEPSEESTPEPAEESTPEPAEEPAEESTPAPTTKKRKKRKKSRIENMPV